MSGAKIKCPSCGSEWTAPVVFCGECGAAIPPPTDVSEGDRAARPPPPAAPVFGPPPPAPAVKAPASKTIVSATTPGDPRSAKANEADLRRTVIGMRAVSVPQQGAAASPAPEAAKPARQASGGKKGKKGGAAAPAEAAETDKLLEVLDAGFDTIMQPAEPTVSVAEPAVSTPEPAVSVPEPTTVPLARALAESPPAQFTAPLAAQIAASPEAPVIDEETRKRQHEADMDHVRALFSEMAVVHARPLRDFMIELGAGDAAREWLDVAAPAAAALRRAADALEMPDLRAALEGFTAAVELASGEANLQGEAKDLLVSAYGKLRELLPAAFSLEGEKVRRDPVIIRSLLLQVPGVQKVALDKIYTAGFTSLEMLTMAGAKEISETTGLDPEIAAAIHDRLQRHRRETADLSPVGDRAAERAELAAAVIELARAHGEHERLSRAWSADAKAGRIAAQRDRNLALLRINVLLARMGEVDRQKAIEKVPFAQKIRDLTAYLEEAKLRASRP